MTAALTKSRKRHPAPDLAEFRKRYPQTVANLGALADREAWLRRIWELDTQWRYAATPWGSRAPLEEVIVRGAPPANLEVEAGFEIIYAGGARALLHAAVMASHYKRRVMVFDSQSSAQMHRDWHISDEELREFERAGLFTQAEIEAAVINRYRSGFVKFYDASSRVKTPPLWVNGVMDVAVDAERLLALARKKIEASGTQSVLMDNLRFVRCYVQTERVAVEVEDVRTGQRRLIAARLFIDASSAHSAVARQLNEGRSPTHVCPTVGTLARGFVRGDEPDKVDFKVGEILVSNDDARDHRQLIWEGFAGSQQRDEYGTYLFFYDALDSPADKSLLALFECYFETLSQYKRRGAQWRVMKPVFGYLPSSNQHGWNSHRQTADERVMLIGDTTGASSPLAFNGLGPQARNLKRLTHLVELALAADLLDAASLSEINAHEPRIAQMSSLAEFLRPTPKSAPAAVNETLNAVMAALHGLDERVRRELFQGCLTLSALKNLLSRTVKLYPRIIGRMREHLGARGTMWWLANIAEVVLHEHRGSRALLTDGAEQEEMPAQRFARYVEFYKNQNGADGLN
jgi:lycopene cyclase CruA